MSGLTYQDWMDRIERMLDATEFDFERRQDIERFEEWVTENPDYAARYIVWLQIAKGDYEDAA